MKKEALTLSNIRQDLLGIAYQKSSKIDDTHLTLIVPITALAILLGILLKSILIGLLIFSVAVYYIIRYIPERKKYNQKRKSTFYILDRGDISISIEQLSHIAFETIYEPSPHRKGSTKEVKYYHFEGGRSWRDYHPLKHYDWSNEYSLSSKGLENISLKGDEFFYISLKGCTDVAYIYPCKLFELSDELKSKQ